MEELIKELKEENQDILLKNPKLAMEFDWSSDAYRLQYNEEMIGKLKLLRIQPVINWNEIIEKPVNYSTVIIDVKTKDGRQWTMPANYRDNRFVECTTNDEFLNIEQSDIIGWANLPKHSYL